jgi:hypothetical protein
VYGIRRIHGYTALIPVDWIVGSVDGVDSKAVKSPLRSLTEFVSGAAAAVVSSGKFTTRSPWIYCLRLMSDYAETRGGVPCASRCVPRNPVHYSPWYSEIRLIESDLYVHIDLNHETK